MSETESQREAMRDGQLKLYTFLMSVTEVVTQQQRVTVEAYNTATAQEEAKLAAARIVGGQATQSPVGRRTLSGIEVDSIESIVAAEGQ